MFSWNQKLLKLRPFLSIQTTRAWHKYFSCVCLCVSSHVVNVSFNRLYCKILNPKRHLLIPVQMIKVQQPAGKNIKEELNNCYRLSEYKLVLLIKGDKIVSWKTPTLNSTLHQNSHCKDINPDIFRNDTT